MVKIFRNIRLRSFADKKFSKYLAYAIGEIILVVIGILIALAINNSNENRLKQESELALRREKVLEMLQTIDTFLGYWQIIQANDPVKVDTGAQ